MPLDASLVGRCFGSIDVVCDTRWLMAYAAGVPDDRPELFDTRTSLVVHPMFAVAPEWELLITHRSAPAAMTAAEAVRGVHAGHDLLIERPIIAGESIEVKGTVVGVGRRAGGAEQRVLFEAVDTKDRIAWRSVMTSVFRGVELVGPATERDIEWPPAPTRKPVESSNAVPIAHAPSIVRAVDAHVYTECARIWNPIHTDTAVAARAGLAAPILHGTATMARAVSAIGTLANFPLASVRRVAGSFSAVVDLGSTIEVRLLDAVDRSFQFDVVAETGRSAIRGGFVTVAEQAE